jgi:hypothetical protein
MKTFLPLKLFAFLLIITSELKAQTDEFAYAITDVSKEGSAWKVLRKLDLKTGEYSNVLLDGTDAKTKAFDATTKKQLPLNIAGNDKTQQSPFTSGVAAIALDKKHNRLFFTPMGFNQLRYIDLSTMQVYYVTDQTFSVVTKEQNGPGKIISRMVITPEGTGYGISNDGTEFIQFTTGKKPMVTQLGSLIDAPENKTISVHNSCSSYGGDIISDEKGNLVLLTGVNHIFKINPETKLATYTGYIQGLPKDFTTNAAVVNGDGQLLLSSAVGNVSNYLLDIKTLKASPFQTNNLAYHTSDLANSNYLTTNKNPFKTIGNLQALKSRLSNEIHIYPNPIFEDSKFNIEFKGLKAGQYLVELVDIAGQPSFQRKISILSKTNTQTISFTPTMAKGLYLVRVVSIDKKHVFEQKLVVQ